jgi:hypothetical protein
VHLDQVRLDGQRPLVGADGLFETVEPVQHIAETAVRFAKLRIGRERLPIVRSGRFQVSEPFQRRGDVVVRRGARRVDGQRLAVMGDRGLGALAADQCVGGALVRVDMMSINAQCGLVDLEGDVGAAERDKDAADLDLGIGGVRSLVGGLTQQQDGLIALATLGVAHRQTAQ